MVGPSVGLGTGLRGPNPDNKGEEEGVGYGDVDWIHLAKNRFQ
jgi:hypothetical protein